MLIDPTWPIIWWSKSNDDVSTPRRRYWCWFREGWAQAAPLNISSKTCTRTALFVFRVFFWNFNQVICLLWFFKTIPSFSFMWNLGLFEDCISINYWLNTWGLAVLKLILEDFSQLKISIKIWFCIIYLSLRLTFVPHWWNKSQSIMIVLTVRTSVMLILIMNWTSNTIILVYVFTFWKNRTQ